MGTEKRPERGAGVQNDLGARSPNDSLERAAATEKRPERGALTEKGPERGALITPGVCFKPILKT